MENEKLANERYFNNRIGKTNIIVGSLIVFLLFVGITNYYNLQQPILSKLTAQNTIHRSPITNNGLTSETYFVTNESRELETGIYNLDSIIYVKFTVLPQSNSSVHFFAPKYHGEEFNPHLQNVTLSPSESFVMNYTIARGPMNGIIYTCYCIDNSNATVLWSYELLYEGRIGFIGNQTLLGIIIPTYLILLFFIKRKKKDL